MNKYLAGAIAGTIATVPMSALMLYLHRQIPREERRRLPPEQITVKVADEMGVEEIVEEEAERKLASTVNHFAYGAATATLYASVAPSIDLPPTVKGTAYGLAVWAGSYLGWLPLFHIREPATERPASENAMMIAAHIVWGAAMGVMLEKLADE
jgi:uncharacterized membrane protein YagU involved in acid resistance